jgi:hypothetical protein
MDKSLDSHGVPVLLGDVKRRVDWVEPFPEGEHLLVCQEAGDDE